MRFALLNGHRREAEPELSGDCLGCGGPMIAKCGEVRIWHWAHRGKRVCDPWWENETPWHRRWKSHFPVEWQEVIHNVPESGERHIADVKTALGWVLEFQHSFLKPNERRARNVFYNPKLAWVVDGTRRSRDKAQFFKALEEMRPISADPVVRQVFIGDVALLKEWAGDRAMVFFDFGENETLEGQTLWCLLPGNSDTWAYLTPFSRAEFIELHRQAVPVERSRFEDRMTRILMVLANYFGRQRQVQQPQVAPLTGLQRQLAWQRSRRRFRF